MCKNDLCRGNNCGERGCVVKRLPFYGDWRTCGPGSTSPECSEPKVTGRCRALMIRYYYDPSSGVCKQFAFGGCDGNHNNFNTMEECQRTCMEARPRLPALNFGKLRLHRG
nr:hypothetical protein BaRGS_035156 [Batillaria attramentaria]